MKTARKLRMDSWQKIIDKLEAENKAKFAGRYIENIDYAVALPRDLRRRVRKIIKYEFDEFDRNVYAKDPNESEIAELSENDTDEELDSEIIKRKRLRRKWKDEHFNESSCSDVERMESEHPHFELKLDYHLKRNLTDETEKDEKDKQKKNWFSSYLAKLPKERIKWDSKVRKTKIAFKDKALEEQAEDLMNAAAENFSSWFNTLGGKEDNPMTPEYVKNLFSIEGDRQFAASILTEPKEVKAVAQTVANKWALPNMSIELKYERLIEKQWTTEPEKTVFSVFGKTVNVSQRPWVPKKLDKPIETVFPSEIVTGEKLFKGISDLRATKFLLDHYRNHPKQERPAYLVEKGMFKVEDVYRASQEVPLYDLWNLNY